MKVFMLGWEFPPHISGGLGTACYGLTKGLDEIGVNVSFVLPTAIPVSADSHITLRTPLSMLAAGPGKGGPQMLGGEAQPAHRFEHVQFHRLRALLQPYATPHIQEQTLRKLLELSAQGKLDLPENLLPKELAEQLAAIQPPTQLPKGAFAPGAGAQYAGDLMGQVYRYARLAVTLSRMEDFDVVHAHDWMTYPAALAVKAARHKPLVVHVHSTEFDRSGEHINQQVYDVERAGMHGADRVVCVSHLTRSMVVARYGVAPEKVRVVYNAVEMPDGDGLQMKPIRLNEKIVLFLGRVTMQKGPEYFLRAAKKVVEKYDNVRFIMAGSGDMITACIREVADLGLGRYVTFTGFLRGQDVDRVFEMADLYVMPSVSEPFGIAPLEALSHNVPVIISKQSGISEVLTHALKVDFWDIDEMANKILAVLRHPPLQKTLRDHGTIELQKFSWRDSAERLREVYQEVVRA
jgi:glycosyltransferase involved in cell wall biosynthesis